ncbi:SH3 domain-containing protein [Microbispora sp. H11081]|uniref:SH3 domain-containing protein n=1 Tax=Microbispora sp. H11081 TaxID=2729107 RepID=UPI0014733921|nr:SH3 domain-containing protein [Microbispora sp. H11081]
MKVVRSIVPALAAWAAAGSILAGHPAPAVAGPAPGPGDPTSSEAFGQFGQFMDASGRGPGVVCTYRLRDVRKGGFLNVRDGAGLRHTPVAKLRPADGGFSGACTATKGWIAVKTAGGASGFAAARYLHRLDLAGRPSLSCVYRLRHVREGSFLNVREGAGIRHAPVGRLRPAGGNIAGACDATHGWVAVDTAAGIPGWASARYLRRL